MEKELFSWGEWDCNDPMGFVFYNPVLKKDLGSLKAGDKFDAAYLNYEDGVLEFHNGDEVVANFSVSLQCVQKI